MAYVIQNGGSGYSMADFVSAIDGKQDALQSGVNIKTVNGQSVLGSGNIEVSAREYDFKLTALEEGLRDAVHNVITDEVSGLNKGHRYLMFGVITDLHQCETPSDLYNTINIYADAVPSLRLLGSIAQKSGLDAVICCGDVVDGNDSVEKRRTTFNYVQSKFREYIPCPYFITDGNHERYYGETGFTNAEWDLMIRSFNNPMGRNIDVVYLNDVIKQEDSPLYYGGFSTYAKSTLSNNESSNSYYIDFNDKKIRVGLLSDFERGGGWYFHGLSVYGILKFLGGKKADEWTVGMCSHNFYGNSGSHRNSQKNLFGSFINATQIKGGASNLDKFYDKPNGETKGKAVFGFVSGHTHIGSAGTYGGFNDICVSRAYSAKSELTQPINHALNTGASINSYCFSLFIVDTANSQLHEICVGRNDRPSGNNGDTSGVTVYSYDFTTSETLSNV